MNTRVALALAAIVCVQGCGSPSTLPEAERGCDPGVRLEPSSAYRVEPGREELVCYGVEATTLTKRHVVEFRPRVDEHAVLHHMTLLQAPAPVSTEPQPCDAEAMTSWRSVFGWSPGGERFELPPEAGFVEEPGTHWVVQLHYLNSGASAREDASGFELCASDELRDNDADIMAFGGHEFTLAPGSETSVSCAVDVPPYGQTTRLFAAFPHMHRLGSSIATLVHPIDGSPPVDIGGVGEWRFDEQRWLAIDHLLVPGDRVETRCRWKNSLSHAVGFGPSTEDEMCYSFTMYYPRIEDPNWHWALPALYAKCKNED